MASTPGWSPSPWAVSRACPPLAPCVLSQTVEKAVCMSYTPESSVSWLRLKAAPS